MLLFHSYCLCYCSIATVACIWYIDFLPPPTLFGVSCRCNFVGNPSVQSLTHSSCQTKCQSCSSSRASRYIIAYLSADHRKSMSPNWPVGFPSGLVCDGSHCLLLRASQPQFKGLCCTQNFRMVEVHQALFQQSLKVTREIRTCHGIAGKHGATSGSSFICLSSFAS